MAGRPPKYDADELIKQLIEYMDATNDPQIAEFCLGKDKPCREHLWELSQRNEELANTIKKLISKQEIYLSRCGNGKLHPTMAIFRLKQPIHGYIDKPLVQLDINQTIEDRTTEQNKARFKELMAKIQGDNTIDIVGERMD